MSNPEREFSGCTRDVFHRNIEEDEPFCTQDNWQSAVMYLNQDIELQGLPSIYNVEQGQSQLDVISLINVTWALLQTQKEKQRKISEQDAQVGHKSFLVHLDLCNTLKKILQVRRLNGDIEHLQTNSQRLRDLIEYKERQASDLECREKQAQVSSTQFRNELKVAKEEIKKLSSLILNREGRFNHEAKKKDQELCKLKERLLKSMSTSSGTSSSRHGISIEVVGQLVEKAEGQTRGRWRTENDDQKRGDELLQKVIIANQERNGFLAQELHNLQEKLNYFLAQLSAQVGQDLRLPTFLPTHSEAFSRDWQAILHMVKGVLPTDSRAETEKVKENDDNDQHQSVQEAFNLSSFVPLSEVKHTAPPEWVSRAAFTLPPSGKAETVKLRGGNSESKPRPKSSHVSPYRGMQARHNTPSHYRSKPSYRSGSMSPNSTSPTR